MRHIPYLVCVLCVQMIADRQSELAQPSIAKERRRIRRAGLEEAVRVYEDGIQQWKQRLAEYNSALARAEGELTELGEFINNIDTLITQLIIMQDNIQDKLETNNNSLRIYICM